MGEAVVSGTKIKMQYKGDTLVYDATAFSMQRDALLGELVKMLPGVELRGGRIYVQGRYVENITLSGKDFLNLKPEEILKMLPAYVVKSLKFYDRQGERSRVAGRDMKDAVYVMDVVLKREYKAQWMSLGVAGYGTEGRYEANGMLMRFDDRQNLIVKADFNNLNKKAEVHEMATIATVYGNGRGRGQFVGLSWSFEPSEKCLFDLSGNYDSRRWNIDQSQAGETYLAGGNLFTRSRMWQRKEGDAWDVRASLRLRPVKKMTIQTMYAFNFNRTRMRSSQRRAQFSVDPGTVPSFGASPLDTVFAAEQAAAAWADYVSYREMTESLNREKVYDHSGEVRLVAGLGRNALNVSVKGRMKRAEFDIFDRYTLSHPATPEAGTDFQHRFFDRGEETERMDAGADYTWKYAESDRQDGQLTPYYQMQLLHKRTDDLRYRLERLEGWGVDCDLPLGSLPSEREWMRQAFDADNSAWHAQRTFRGELGLRWNHEWMVGDSMWVKVNATLPVAYSHRNLYYHLGTLSAPVKTDAAFLTPQFRLQWMPARNDRNGNVARWEFGYRLMQQEPSLLSLPGVTDHRDPLVENLGNPGLKNAQTHVVKVGGNYRKRSSRLRTYGSVRYEAMRDAIAMYSVYDRKTGIATYRPVNVNGNYRLSGTLGLNVTINPKTWSSLDYSIHPSFGRNIDLNRTVGEEAAVRSSVKTFTLSQNLNFVWRPVHTLSIYSQAFVRYDRSFSATPGFQTIDVWNFSPSLQVTWEVEEWEIGTKFGVQAQRGYSDGAMNRTDFLLDATLSRSFFNDRLTLKLATCDLLRQQRRTWNSLNAQGRTETLYNLYIPSYIMLKVAWRVNGGGKK